MEIALFSFLGIIAGALLQYFFTQHLEHQRHLRELKTKAYTDYMLCVCEHANFGKTDPAVKSFELGSKTANAKSRICLYGSQAVVEAFATFEKLGATMNTPEQRTAFSNMVALMRKDSGIQEGLKLTSIEVVLLGVNAT